MADVSIALGIDDSSIKKMADAIASQVSKSIKNLGLGGKGNAVTAGATAAASFAILQGIFNAVKGVPIIEAMSKMLRLMLVIFFLPFAKFIPAMATTFNWLATNLGKGMQGNLSPGDAASAVGATAIAGAGAGAVVGGSVAGPVGAAAGAAIGTAVGLLPDAAKGIKNIADLAVATFGVPGTISDALDGILAKAGINMPAVRAAVADAMDSLQNWGASMKTSIDSGLQNVQTAIVDFFTVTIPTFLMTTLPDAWKQVWTFFTVTVPAWITTQWESVKTFFGTTVPGWITGAWNSVKTFFTETIPAWIQTMIDTIKSALSHIPGLGGLAPKKAIGGPINNDGLFMLHKGERVISATQNNPQQGGNSITVNINVDSPTVSKEADIQALTRQISLELQQSLRGYVSYANLG